MTVGIVGGGAIGGFLAAALAAAGVTVVVLERDPTIAHFVALRRDGTPLEPRAAVEVTTDPSALGTVDVCIVAVKASATSEVAQTLAEVLPPDAVVVSFQNGMHNVERLRAALRASVVGGVVTFHVVRQGDTRRQCNPGKLIAGQATGRARRRMQWLRSTLGGVGVRLELRRDIDAAIAGKLLLNLNNGVCAATGLGIGGVLRSSDARWCLSQLIREGLDCMRMASILPSRVGGVPLWLMPYVLRLPDAVFVPAARMLSHLDDGARSSTLADLDAGRSTEIDELNGAIVCIAERSGHDAPLNRLVTRTVHEHERAVMSGDQPLYMPPRTLRAQLERVIQAADTSSRRSPFQRMSSK